MAHDYFLTVMLFRIVNRSGNPYGSPVKYLDVLGANVSPTEGSVSLEREFPIGTKVCVLVKQVDSPFVHSVAIQVRHIFILLR